VRLQIPAGLIGPVICCFISAAFGDRSRFTLELQQLISINNIEINGKLHLKKYSPLVDEQADG